MVAVALVCFGLLSYLAMRSNDGPMALLYGDLDLREASQVIDQLDKAHIAHKTEAGGSRVLVVRAIRSIVLVYLLAKEGLPSGGSIGYEIFDRSDGLTANSFQQGIAQTRALEGESSPAPFVPFRASARPGYTSSCRGASHLPGNVRKPRRVSSSRWPVPPASIAKARRRS